MKRNFFSAGLLGIAAIFGASPLFNSVVRNTRDQEEEEARKRALEPPRNCLHIGEVKVPAKSFADFRAEIESERGQVFDSRRGRADYEAKLFRELCSPPEPKRKPRKRGKRHGHPRRQSGVAKCR
jgi:hypothetical protein